MGKKKTINIIGNIIFYGMLLIFIIISATMLRAKASGKQPSILGNKFFIVLTGSMSPTIKVGDLVVVKDINPEDISADDVITFGSTSSANITTHRVKEVLNEGGNISYITQGDANNVEDPMPVESEVVLGKVSKVVPKAGTIILWIQKNIMDILIGIVAIIAGRFLFTTFKRKINKEKDEEVKEIIE